jgi:gliding motility-associated-like protein
MTATPIPRTLAMTFYGDLDVSVIDELPPGRKPITTIHKFESYRLRLFGFMKEQIELKIDIPSNTDFDVEKTCTDQELVLEVKLSTEGVNYVWKNGSTPIVGSTNATFNIDDYLADNQSLSLPLNINASVTKDGCTVEKSFIVENNPCKLIPRGISPNNDDSNDTFDLTGYGVRELIIYNRYGAKVFNFKGNYTNQWKGQSDDNDELPDGTYFYSIQYSSGDPQTGWVYINRQN